MIPINDFDGWMMDQFAIENPDLGKEFENEFNEWVNNLDYPEICEYVQKYTFWLGGEK